MFDQLKIIKKKYLNLQKELIKGNIDLKDTFFLKEIGELEKIVSFYDKYLEYQEEKQKIDETSRNDKFKEDKEFLFLLQQEQHNLEKKIENILLKLKSLLFPKVEKNDKKVIMEIKGAAGGNESNLFVGDLFRAYTKYAENRNWKIKIINLISSLKNGITSVIFEICGDNVYSFLKHESGIHRVQRIPITEKKGRTHTSTVKIIVTPDIEKKKIDLNWNDVRIDTFNASGPGGQSVNTTKSAVRLTHLTTGMSVASQVAKSQHQNKEKAFELLQEKVYHKIVSKQHKENNDIKKKLIGKGERSQKIRTYHYAQNRITDHRFNLTLHKLDLFMEGKIDLLIIPLIDEFIKHKN
ncbi:PCRF domain-containing protein [Candidatus Phytoplasma pini]|nr:PCRF domain-containing protein [Candidatus Phytoplasma pini]